jgi:S-adenosylmethionine-diacylgycerolhomoserine-N-methlytransferase
MSDIAVLWRLARGMPHRGGHAERLEGFYAGQADAYDRFREKLLHGRDELLKALPLVPGGTLIEFGCGTGRNIHAIGDRLATLESATGIDLCPSLLHVGRRRAAELGWKNVRLIEADACTWKPDQPVDVVVFAYALTMIPDWRAALRNAIACLRPGGTLAVVDFTVIDPAVAALGGCVPQSAPVRWAWKRWFGHDGVHPDATMLPELIAATEPVDVHVGRGSVPYLPVTAGYLRYIGRRR